ncbi:hypothetical protein [uncultured Brachyspira sp.]|nr:hypothetical protein [uncultured Brachyspira sp.]
MDYEKKYKEQLNENIKKVIEEIDSDYMNIKISKFAEKYDESPESIKKKIIEDEIFRKIFAKEPSKQNFYQNVAAEYIKNIDGVEDFEVLPQGGDKAMYMVSGNLIQGKSLKNKNQNSKSIDFYWRYYKYEVYASHKFIKEEGGAQDNQYQDVQNFLNDSRDNNLKDTYIIAICDGNYFKSKDNKTGDETKLKRLERLTNHKNTFVIDIERLGSILKKIKD